MLQKKVNRKTNLPNVVEDRKIVFADTCTVTIDELLRNTARDWLKVAQRLLLFLFGDSCMSLL